MTKIVDLPSEVLLLIFGNTASLKDLCALSRTCNRFRSLIEQNERPLSMDIAARHFPVPYKILGFGGRAPSISSLLVLVGWIRETDAFTRWCNSMRLFALRDENFPSRAVWCIPLWQEHFKIGLLLYKMLSLSAPRMEKLEQLPGPFHALLRFTSIMVCDVARAFFATLNGEVATRQMRGYFQSGRAPGDTPPWLQDDSYWRVTEILLFEQGWDPFIKLMNRTFARDWRRRRGVREDSLLRLFESGRLSRDRQHHLRLDALCLAYGHVWGGPNFWRTFDPFGLNGKGLSGHGAMEEMVKHLPG